MYGSYSRTARALSEVNGMSEVRHDSIVAKPGIPNGRKHGWQSKSVRGHAVGHDGAGEKPWRDRRNCCHCGLSIRACSSAVKSTRCGDLPLREPFPPEAGLSSQRLGSMRIATTSVGRARVLCARALLAIPECSPWTARQTMGTEAVCHTSSPKVG